MKHRTREALVTQGAKYQHFVGEWTYGNPRILWYGEKAGLYIGRFSSIGANVSIFLGGNHRPDWVTTYPFNVLDAPHAAKFKGHPHSNGDVRIGNDVWLGDSCRIMSGVTIGDGVCVAANAVVTKDVAPYSIVGGLPAKLIRMRFEPYQIDALLKIKWWDWPLELVRKYYHLMLSTDIDAFIEAAEKVTADDIASHADPVVEEPPKPVVPTPPRT